MHCMSVNVLNHVIMYKTHVLLLVFNAIDDHQIK